jgi:outer membrane protein OmpA-like peptidoglycan-associated protein
MTHRIFSAFFLFGAACAFAQQSGPAPIYHVTVTERTVKAINYQYRAEPTLIDFRGTVLLPNGKGLASVESKQGRTEIDVRFENLTEPGQFGREYLTYVLWALTPDGRPLNLGEVVANGGDKAHMRVTTEAQAFAMIVTAEPYSAVRQPSDVVVLENQVRPDTVGKIEEVTARYELLPRGQYSWQIPDKLAKEAEQGPKVSMRKYEALLELYQAQNAVGIASSAHAAQYAPNTFAKAQQLLAEAQQLNDHKGDNARIVETAREASQAAEDARLISVRRRQEDQIANAQSQVAAARQAQARAEQDAQRLRADAQAAQAQADAERAERQQAEADAAAARAEAAQLATAPPPPTKVVVIAPSVARTDDRDAARTEYRMRLLEQMNGPLETRDTPRGLVAVVPNSGFMAGDLRSPARDQVSRIAAIVMANPSLRIEVEGHSDSESDAPLAWKRAEAVRQALIARGISPNSVTSRGLGNTRPLTSNATPAGREANERVEIVISGDPIGTMPFWDKKYPLRVGGGQ